MFLKKCNCPHDFRYRHHDIGKPGACQLTEIYGASCLFVGNEHGLGALGSLTGSVKPLFTILHVGLGRRRMSWSIVPEVALCNVELP